jgi:P-type E1-E2 ATPase
LGSSAFVAEERGEPDSLQRETTPEIEVLMLSLAALAGTLSVALLLAGDVPVTRAVRLVLVGVGALLLAAEHLMRQRDVSDTHPVVSLAAPLGSALLAAVQYFTDAQPASSATTLAGVLLLTTAGLLQLMQKARRPAESDRLGILFALDQKAHRVSSEETVPVRAKDLRPGEEVVVEAGEIVPADITVSAGQATVSPWLSANERREVGEGDTLVSGAQVVRGRLRAVVGWAGHDRTWTRLISDPRRRADSEWPLARTGKHMVERGAPLAAGLGALTAYAANQDHLTITMFALAAFAAIANPVCLHAGAMTALSAVLSGLKRGIAYRSAEALDQTGKTHVVTFCARGTLLLGEPELANIEPVGEYDAETVLGLLAGAESGATHPVAVATMRAARARGVRPAGARNHHFEPGLGITAVAPDGERLVVGSRALMLKERISVAVAETTLGELEALGRSVLLIALGGRLIGVVGLQDGLRPGARAAVQYLLDTGVEPVLMTGDARETSEVLARTLDIEHVRPEVLPTERGEVVRRLAESGSRVAVVGRSPMDDAALGAADVSVALASAGSTVSEWSVQLATHDIKEAAYAIRLAHLARREAKVALSLVLVPAGLATLAMCFALAPPVAAPIAATVGAGLALLRLRSHFGLQ